MDAVLTNIAPSRAYKTMEKVIRTYIFILAISITFCGCHSASTVRSVANSNTTTTNNNNISLTVNASPAADPYSGDVPVLNDTPGSQLTYADDHAIVLVGGSSLASSRSVSILKARSICPDDLIPALPVGRRASFAAYVASCIIVCGGRESLLEIGNECWKYNLTLHHHNYETEEEPHEDGLWKEWQLSNMGREVKKSWTQVSPLPRSLAGSAVVSYGGKMWVFGGLVEEDYYDMEKQNEYYYYDYVIEVAGNGVVVYDPVKDEWNVTNVVLPSARQGACAVVANDKIILTGGKGHMEDLTGSDQVWEFDPQAGKWNHNRNWPKMKRQRYYHGCTVGQLANETGIFIVGGRGDEYNEGNTAEFLSFEISKKGKKWIELPHLIKAHPNMPGVIYSAGTLFVLGGGGTPFSGGENTIETFGGMKWSSFTALRQERSFASSISVPNKWFAPCEMEPNLGIYRYHQKKTIEMLKGKQWLCKGEHLQLSEQDEHVMIGGCTVPGCHYPHFFSHHANASIIKSLRVRGGRLTCRHADYGTPANRIECRLSCRKGWENVQNVGVTICTKGQAEALAKIKSLADNTAPSSLQKTTNFTTDYLECRRNPIKMTKVLQINGLQGSTSALNSKTPTDSEEETEVTTPINKKDKSLTLPNTHDGETSIHGNAEIQTSLPMMSDNSTRL